MKNLVMATVASLLLAFSAQAAEEFKSVPCKEGDKLEANVVCTNGMTAQAPATTDAAEAK